MITAWTALFRVYVNQETEVVIYGRRYPYKGGDFYIVVCINDQKRIPGVGQMTDGTKGRLKK